MDRFVRNLLVVGVVFACLAVATLFVTLYVAKSAPAIVGRLLEPPDGGVGESDSRRESDSLRWDFVYLRGATGENFMIDAKCLESVPDRYGWFRLRACCVHNTGCKE